MPYPLIILIISFHSLLLSGHVIAGESANWTRLEAGLELGKFTARKPSVLGSSTFTILRIDAKHWEIDFAGISQTGDNKGQTARQWARQHDFTAVINAGMFAKDYKTHVGFLRVDDHINSRHINKYQSAFAFAPKAGKLVPAFRIFDLDEPNVTIKTIMQDYNGVVQNLRLIKRPGINRWQPQQKQWSEAAIGEDKQGRILFIFTRSPFNMYHFIQELLAMDINLVAAQHLEGGPEAQLYLKTDTHELEMFGNYETSFHEDKVNKVTWPIPNVLGIRRRVQTDKK